jgi:AraC-like DNA-binding protein
MNAGKLKTLQYDSNDGEPGERFGLFREGLSGVTDVTLYEANEDNFRVSGTAWMLGQIMVNAWQIRCGLRFERNAARVRADGLDQYYLVMMHEDALVGDADGAAIHVKQGGVVVMERTRAMHAVMSPSRSSIYVVPRDDLQPLLPSAGSRHGLVVQGAAGNILADYLRALEQQLPELTLEEAPHIARGTCDLIAACVAPSRERMEQASSQLAQSLRREAKRVVDARLADPELRPEAVAEALRISRASLYKLFEAEGGVSVFIRRRRLRAVSRLLMEPDERRRISELAYACGFISEAHFSRAFREEFGATPSDMRAARRATPASAADGTLHPTAILASWMAKQD